MKMMMHRAICFLEIVVLVAFLFVVTVPERDYAMSEFKRYMDQPSPKTLQAFRNKKEDEVRLREMIAIPLGLFALAIPILRNSRRRRNRQA